MKKRRVFLVDDHPIVRHGLSVLINQQPDLAVCGEAEFAYQAADAAATAKMDAMIVDISLKGVSGLELIKTLKAKHPAVPVLVVSMHDEVLYAERALRAGARGYVMKYEATEKVVAALREVLSGRLYLSEKMSQKLLNSLGAGAAEGVSSLTDRELEIFQLIGEGRGTREIAERLHLSVKTVESHRANIKEKLHIESAPQLVQHAVEWLRDGDASRA